ncbi:MAG: thiamine-phosphate diphosphorylase [Candidatus Firestonebacteria bacterium RIFOXYC2_FULL_39_67]|nr:MAG: thiamine-phosphate diphosphorylase [Candidatus Firestonebacteria bacterium RIFOXYD2_FULL_39_29]OGF56741.1 MAG: thiamine-phosphate diphosphorylase [Candidatus Firestonebacteria bacterium RIFOXYC2_FULL_39_67]
MYAIIDPEVCALAENDPLSVAKICLNAGVKIIQLRHKNAPDDIVLYLAKRFKKECQKHKALFILNDRADLAVLAGADGLHLGQKDLPVREARKIFKGFIGISTHNNKEIMKALKGNVDYIGFGPVFRTNTKKGLPPVAGLRRLENVVSKVSIPVVAIGGINSTNIKEVYKSGVSCAAVISAICGARKPITKIKALITKKEAY